MINVILLIMLVTVVIVERPLNPFWLWNAIPIVLGYILVRRAKSKSLKPIPEYGYIAVGGGLVFLVHLAWAFNWCEGTSGSSTSGLIFLFLPAYALVAGGLTFGLIHSFVGRQLDPAGRHRQDDLE